MEINSILDDYKVQHACVCSDISELNFFDNNQSNISVIHVNIRSIYQNFDQFLVFLESLQRSFDVIIMSETHYIYNCPDFNIPGYNIIFNESNLNRCDGCVVYVKQDLFLGHEILVEEQLRIIKVTLQKNNLLVNILATYKGFGLTKESFIYNLDSVMQRVINDQNQIYIFTGDTNIDLLKVEEDMTNNYLTMMQSHGFVSKINKPTRKTADSISCLDHYFVKCCETYFNQINTAVLEHDLTDHNPILLSLQTDKKNPEYNKSNSYQKIDYEKLKNCLQGAKWDDVLNSWDSDRCASIFVDRFKSILIGCTKTKIITCKKKIIKPWITMGILTSIRNRNKLKRECTLNNNNLILLQRYNNYRSMLSKLIKNAKYSFYKKLAQKNLKDPKKLWRVVREATNDHNTQSEIKSIISSDNIELSSKKQIADEFNNYFSKIGKKLAQKIKNSVVLVEEQGIQRVTKSCYLNPITDTELIKEINNLKNKVKGGKDCISSDLVKKYKEYLIKPLSHLVNVVFSTGIFPEIFKTATIIPLYKQGDKKSTNNYRPIALTSTISKLLEKCIKLRMLSFLEKNKLLNENQFAFRENSSTENALCRVTETILRKLDQGKKVIGIFLDLQKAFDTVAHQILLKRLNCMGIRGTPNNLIKSYLERKQCTKIINEVSEEMEVEFGVPQGTVLSTLLFNIYISMT